MTTPDSFAVFYFEVVTAVPVCRKCKHTNVLAYQYMYVHYVQNQLTHELKTAQICSFRNGCKNVRHQNCKFVRGQFSDKVCKRFLNVCKRILHPPVGCTYHIIQYHAQKLRSVDSVFPGISYRALFAIAVHGQLYFVLPPLK